MNNPIEGKCPTCGARVDEYDLNNLGVRRSRAAPIERTHKHSVTQLQALVRICESRIQLWRAHVILERHDRDDVREELLQCVQELHVITNEILCEHLRGNVLCSPNELVPLAGDERASMLRETEAKEGTWD